MTCPRNPSVEFRKATVRLVKPSKGGSYREHGDALPPTDKINGNSFQVEKTCGVQNSGFREVLRKYHGYLGVRFKGEDLRSVLARIRHTNEVKTKASGQRPGKESLDLILKKVLGGHRVAEGTKIQMSEGKVLIV